MASPLDVHISAECYERMFGHTFGAHKSNGLNQEKHLMR